MKVKQLEAELNLQAELKEIESETARRHGAST